MHSEITKLAPKDFPELLKEIADPPEQLYVRGTLPFEETPRLCVVGSRRHTQYGRQACEKLISGLSGSNIAIVSGLALGIDAVAHKAALAADLPTIAVPGSGISDAVLYPATNRGLAHAILSSDGALLSEYEPDFRATQWSFPRRNRIMAGLSHAVLIIEAAEQSGTLITARLATEYNRDVLAVPGSILSDGSRGTNALIRDGAVPVSDSADILEAFGIAPRETAGAAPADLSDDEQTLVSLLAEPLPRDELIRRSALAAPAANILLTQLEMKGVVRENAGIIYPN